MQQTDGCAVALPPPVGHRILQHSSCGLPHSLHPRPRMISSSFYSSSETGCLPFFFHTAQRFPKSHSALPLISRVIAFATDGSRATTMSAPKTSSNADNSETAGACSVQPVPPDNREVGRCNGQPLPMEQPTIPLEKFPSREDSKQDKRTGNPGLLEAQFGLFCEADVCLSDKAKHDAMLLFRETRPFLVASLGALGSGTEEQMVRLWSACILYCASRLTHDTSMATTSKLSRLLEITNVSVCDFFRELPQFLQKADSILRAVYGDVHDRLRQVKDLQANFVHLTVLFNYYKRNYYIFFLPSESTKSTSSSTAENGPLTTSNRLRFGWMLFLALRSHVLSQFDLVTCTNGLIATLVIMIAHTPVHLRTFSLHDSEMFAIKSPAGVNIVASLCNLYEASEEDVQRMVDRASEMIREVLHITHDSKLQNHAEQLLDIDKEGLTYFEGLLEESSLPSYLEILDKDYEEIFKHGGELDERMFLNGDDAICGTIPDGTAAFDGIPNVPSAKRKHEMMSSPLKAAAVKASMLSPPDSPSPSSMKVISTKMLPPTPVTLTMTTAKWLRTVIAPLPSELPPDLLLFFRSCDTDITRQVTYRAQVLLEAIFPRERPANWGVVGGIQGIAFMDSIWAEQRRSEALKLYYRVLGAMCRAESQRLHCNNLSALLTNERFHRCMLACSAELVLATYKTVSMNFPAVLEPTGITAFDLWKVIESFVRHEETLPRELKRHLNSIEEKLLEKLAWEKGSSMYNSLIVAKPNLQSEIYRLGLLADPMPSLDTLNSRYRISNGGVQTPPLNSRAEVPSGESPGQSSPSRQVPALSTALIGASGSADKAGSDLISPIKERPSAFSAFAMVKTRMQPPLQSAFASPQRPSPVGGGETCAETVINVFFQKVLKLAAIRIKLLCESLKQSNHVMEEVYKTVQCILHHETCLFFKRHIDQIILCSIYGVCKVKQLNLTFKEIVQHYKLNPHDPHIYRTVFLDLPSARPAGKGGQGIGDIIRFYNGIFVPTTKGFLMQSNMRAASGSRTTEDGEKTDGQLPGSPGPSPFSSLPDISPKKVSANHNVYVSPLRSSKMESLRSPHSRSLYACVGESTHSYQSPSKDLTEINNRVNNRRLGRLDFGDAGLVSDSLVAGSLYPCNMNINTKPLKSDSVLSQSQSLSWSNCTPTASPSKRPCPDR